jgi:hypothetical protein
MASSSIDHYDQIALLDRLTMGIEKSGQSVVFLVGSALTAPVPSIAEAAGVPNVQGVIKLIENEFPPDQISVFKHEIASSAQPYQAAFSHLIGRRGQTAANNIIKRAVLMARLTPPPLGAASLTDAECDNLDQGAENWNLSPAVSALGKLIALRPKQFGQTILTTNFDPLLEISIRSAGGLTFRTVLHRDGKGNLQSLLDTLPLHRKKILLTLIQYLDANVLTFSVSGLDRTATAQLFEKRGVTALYDPTCIGRARSS